jgi:hypothetical protein
MFTRFRQAGHRLQVSLVETRRADGRVRHEHVASLGSIRDPANDRRAADVLGSAARAARQAIQPRRRRRVYSVENFQSAVQKDFCNKIGQRRKCLTV